MLVEPPLRTIQHLFYLLEYLLDWPSYALKGSHFVRFLSGRRTHPVHSTSPPCKATWPSYILSISSAKLGAICAGVSTAASCVECVHFMHTHETMSVTTCSVFIMHPGQMAPPHTSHGVINCASALESLGSQKVHIMHVLACANEARCNQITNRRVIRARRARPRPAPRPVAPSTKVTDCGTQVLVSGGLLHEIATLRAGGGDVTPKTPRHQY